MKFKKICINILYIFLASTLTLLTACSSNQNSGSSSGSSQSDPGVMDAVSDLIEFENNIEMTINALGGPAVQKDKQQTSSSSQASSGNESQGNQSSQQSQGSHSSQQEQQHETSNTSQQNSMDKISQIVDKMHYQWNDLMPEAIKRGAKKDLIDNIDTSLNELSITTASKNKMNALLAANKLYKYIPDLYALIKPKPSPEIKRILYYSRNVILNSAAANWAQTDLDIKSLKSSWDLYKNGLSKNQKDVANKLELSIYELEKVVKQKNQSLVNIKGKVEFSNIIALEEATGSESGGNSQLSGGN